MCECVFGGGGGERERERERERVARSRVDCNSVLVQE